MPDPGCLSEEVDQDEDEEAPSLCDLPLTGAGEDHQSNERRRSLSEIAEFFEFSTPDLNRSDLFWPLFSSPDDGNRLTRTSNPPPPSNCIIKSLPSKRLSGSETRTRSSSIRSLGHRRIRRELMPNRLNRVRFPSDREIRCGSGNGLQRRSPPPWYRLALRPLRFPAPAEVIELRPSPPMRMFPAGEKACCDRSKWKLINALSCKSHGSVSATTPFQPYL